MSILHSLFHPEIQQNAVLYSGSFCSILEFRDHEKLVIRHSLFGRVESHRDIFVRPAEDEDEWIGAAFGGF